MYLTRISDHYMGLSWGNLIGVINRLTQIFNGINLWPPIYRCSYAQIDTGEHLRLYKCR